MSNLKFNLQNNSSVSQEPLRQNRGRYILRRIFRRPKTSNVDENGGRFLLPFIESAVQVRFTSLNQSIKFILFFNRPFNKDRPYKMNNITI
jgi:hypothetical protein